MAAIAAMVMMAVALTGCGGTKESPGGPSGTGVPAGAANLVVPDSVRGEMLDVLKAASFTVGDPVYVYMNYVSDAKDQIVVTGALRGPKDLVAGAAAADFTKVTLANVKGKWMVTGAK